MAFSIGELFGFSGINIGMGRVGTIALVIGISLFIVILVGIIVYFVMVRRHYRFIVPVWRRVGNVSTRVGTFRAKLIPVGRAGDTLWFVKGVKKYLPPGTIQSASNEYWYWIREDGEWINFGVGDLDEEQKKANVKYIHQDMRMQRLATDRLLEQRLMQKSFWEKWGTTISLAIFFIVIAVSLVIFMYMFGKTIDKIGDIAGKLDNVVEKVCGEGGSTSGMLVPAMFMAIPLKLFRRKKEDEFNRSRIACG